MVTDVTYLTNSVLFALLTIVDITLNALSFDQGIVVITFLTDIFIEAVNTAWSTIWNALAFVNLITLLARSTTVFGVLTI